MGRMGLNRQTLATILEAGGLLVASIGVGTVSIWGGLVTLGAGMVVFGIAVEREEG